MSGKSLRGAGGGHDNHVLTVTELRPKIEAAEGTATNAKESLAIANTAARKKYVRIVDSRLKCK